MRVVLVRHPKPSIAPGICYGRLDVGIEDGRGTPDHDARDGPRWLAGFGQNAPDVVGRMAADPGLCGATRVWTSPARRCRGVAEAIARALAVPLTVDPRLQELDFGAWEGRPWDAIARADLDRWAVCPLRFAPPGGETGAELVARVGDFHAGLRQDCVVVSHGGPLKVLAALLDGRPIDLLAAAPPLGSIRVFAWAAP
jgi:alpha-ribazole phosphatase